tara:strand:- start:635 stop:1597 length:963 start_codon:yes stop_codon:yes gene_type:complete
MSELILWNKMKNAVVECHSVDEIKQLRDKAEAYRYALKQAKESPGVIRKAEEIKLRAERRAGELLKETVKHGGDRKSKKIKSSSQATNLKNMGITPDQSSRWQKIANIPEEKFENYLEVEKELSTSGAIRVARQIERQEKIEEIKKSNPQQVEGIYQVIYADPPWKYNDQQNTEKLGGAEKHYPTMSIEDLCELNIGEIADKNSILFLWTTSPLLEDTFLVINAWGFNYKSSFVWDKVKHNMGHYNSVRHEFLLICTRGSYTPQNIKLFDSVQSIEKTNKHSEKPEEFREIINTLYPYSNKIELFGRKKVDGWDVWGNQV